MRRYSQSAGFCFCLAVFVFGCERPLHERQAKMPPEPGEMLPEWAFDAPYYFRPPSEAVAKVVSKADPDLPEHCYVRERVFLIERPAGEVQFNRLPHIAVWWTNTNGCEWIRAGFFGLGQSHFPFVAGDDGDYGIRFLGPGIKESLTEETIPHRIYHLDIVPPGVEVTIEPEHPIYEPNEVIWVHWRAEDRNLDKKGVRLAMCWSWENPDLLEYRQSSNYPPNIPGEEEKAGSRFWKPLKPEFEPEGVLAYTIPDFAAGEGFQFQVRAKDRAGNYGVGYSQVIFVSGHKGAEKQLEPFGPDSRPTDTSAGKKSTTRPAPRAENNETLFLP